MNQKTVAIALGASALVIAASLGFYYTNKGNKTKNVVPTENPLSVEQTNVDEQIQSVKSVDSNKSNDSESKLYEPQEDDLIDPFVQSVEIEEFVERTLILVKPDGVQRAMVGKMIATFEKKGFKLVGLKQLNASNELLQQHYADLSQKPFFPKLIEYMLSGPIVAMVWEGEGVVAAGRRLLGETRPVDSEPASIRGMNSIDIGRNVAHGSDSIGSAKREIELWFPEHTVRYEKALKSWVFEK